MGCIHFRIARNPESLSLSLTPFHAHTHSHIHTHTYTHIHTYTHTSTHSHQPTHTSSHPHTHLWRARRIQCSYTYLYISRLNVSLFCPLNLPSTLLLNKK